MKTNFFTQFLAIGIEHVTIELKKVGDKVVVVTTPKTVAKDSGLKSIKPLVFSNYSAEELDEGFFEAVVVPLQKVSETFKNIESFESSIDEAKKNTDMAKKEQDKAKLEKEKSKKLEANLKKYVESLTEPGHYILREEKLLNFIAEIVAVDPTNKYVEKVKKDIADNKVKHSNVGLFGEAEPIKEHIEPNQEPIVETETEESEDDEDESEEE